MKNLILAALLSLTATQSFAATAIYTCGDLTISDNCDVDVCRVSLQVSDDPKNPFYITIGELDGVKLNHDYQVEQLNLFPKQGKMYCVAGEVFNDFIPVATTAE